MKITIPNKDLIQNQWRNKNLLRQEKAKRIQYHQTSFTTNVKGTYTVKKYNRRKKDPQIQHKTIKKMAIGTHVSIITLNGNGLNAPTKRHRLAEWIQKQDPYICSLQETHFRPQDTSSLKVRGWKKIFHANRKQKKTIIAILISDKIDLKIKKSRRGKDGHYIMIKGSIQEEDITIVNIYAPNTGAPQYIRQTLTYIRGETDRNTVIVGDFTTPLTPMGRSSEQKINKETQVLSDTLDEMDLIDIFRTFHPNEEEYNFFSHWNILQDTHLGSQIKPQ